MKTTEIIAELEQLEKVEQVEEQDFDTLVKLTKWLSIHVKQQEVEIGKLKSGQHVINRTLDGLKDVEPDERREVDDIPH